MDIISTTVEKIANKEDNDKSDIKQILAVMAAGQQQAQIQAQRSEDRHQEQMNMMMQMIFQMNNNNNRNNKKRISIVEERTQNESDLNQHDENDS